MREDYNKIVNKRNRLLRRLDETLIQTCRALDDEEEFPTQRELMDLVEFVRQEQNAYVGQGKYRVEIR